MRIAYIVLKGMPLGGGIEKYTEEVGSRLVKKGHQITVYTMNHYGAKNGYYKGMRVKTVPTIKIRSLEKLTASLLATIQHCLEMKTDIFHFHAFGPAMFCFIPRLLGKNVVVQGHGIEWKRSRWGILVRAFLKLTEYPSVKWPHQITVVSKVQKEYLKNRYGVESVYVPPGVNPPHIEKPELIRNFSLEGNDYIFFAARLVREKGVHYLIEAYQQLKTNLKLVIAGDAEHEDVYKSELYRMAGKAKNIIFTGFVTGKLLHELFSNCYIFVLPSELEGLPMALLEAMSYGNCCLVSDIPENLEAISNYGYSFKNRDVEDLTSKLEYLKDNDEAVNSFKESAREYVLQSYSWDKIASNFEEIYIDLINNTSH
jgi:glycosyltransferase involved in cell wall biosynthesis